MQFAVNQIFKMRRDYDATLGMYKAVKAMLTANASTITAAAVPIITTYNTDLDDQIKAIEAKSPQTAISSLGITQTKKEARFATIKSAVAIAGAMYSYAVDTNNTDLAIKMNITPSVLKFKKDEEVLDILNNILAKASALVTVVAPAINPLADYGVSVAEVAALEGLITAYTNITTAPRLVISTRKARNQELANLYATTDALMIKLDKIMTGLKDSYPEFYEEYFNARKLVGPIRKHTRIAGKIGNSQGKPIAGVNVTAVSTAEPFVTYQAISNDEGNYSVRTPKFRLSYIVKYSKSGYGDMQESNVKVKLGKTTTRNIQMKPVIQS